MRRNRVRELRENKLLTQRQLGKRSGLSGFAISRVERGCVCRPSTEWKILRGLGMRPEDYALVFLKETE